MIRTLDTYKPALRETQAFFYLPKRAALGWFVVLVLLVCAMSYAWHWPRARTAEAVQQLAQLRQRMEVSQNKTRDLVDSTRRALEEKGMPPETSARIVAAIGDQLGKLQPVTPESLDAQAVEQADAYTKAQATIATSPFKGMPVKDVPPTADGEAYLQALRVKPVKPLRYQRLADGVAPALQTLGKAVALQAQAEQLWARFAGQDKAEPGEVTKTMRERALSASADEVTAPRSRDLPVPPRFTSPIPSPISAAPSDELSPTQRAMRELDLAVERKRQEQVAAKAEAQRVEAEQRRVEQQVRAEANRKEREVQMERQRVEAEAQRRQQAAEQQARQAERQAQQVAQENARQVEAKRRECTSSLIARAACAAQGYNPLTGLKN